ncbi:hypothetical protein NLJ89_g9730 [Agrocybe chaxingu]|uniref:Uncharacterized protein n=1 Tax=Agrocybe chaxingu TaxID=84603 RepID=A0A9W8MQY0_9AGAR|nr:hypothetical protein NLJ89_g9730 [Agrocybe chaxingu]
MPAKLGRLPSLIGEPAGGSLTADQWLVFATVVAPLAIPQIWEEFLPVHLPVTATAADRANRLAETQAARRQAAKEAAQAKRQTGRPPPETTSTRPQRTPPTHVKHAMDIDPDSDNGVDEGALEGDEEEYGMNTQHAGTRKRRRNKANEITPEDEARDEATPINLRPEDPGNFLKLCMAIQLLVQRRITEEDLKQADSLLRGYCAELVKLYGDAVIRPNHHYAIHTPDSVRDYGPLHKFWTFLFERLNKVLKSYKTNNHGRGEIETSFFREFHRTVQETRLVAQAATSPDENLRRIAGALYKASADDRGTVQALAQELDEAQETGGIQFQLSARSQTMGMPDDLYYQVLKHFTLRLEPGAIRSYISTTNVASSQPLNNIAVFFDHVVIDQNRYGASRRMAGSADCFIAVSVSNGTAERLWVGELLDIFALEQAVLGGLHRFGHVRWLVPAQEASQGTIWQTFEPTGVRLWQHDQFIKQGVEEGPPTLIPLDMIQSYAIRSTVKIANKMYWATIFRKQ